MTVEPSEPRRDAVVRISDIDRGAALATLQQAELEGRLTAAELEERITRLRDTRTRGELDVLLADLPGQRTRPEETVELHTGTGSIKRAGAWTVPRRLIVTSDTGSIRLDFTEATIAYDEVDIELRIGTASAHIILPPGASADINHFRGGTVRSKVPDHRVADAPHFRISGSAGTGSLRVQHRRWWFG
jgi:hypothetical protein